MPHPTADTTQNAALVTLTSKVLPVWIRQMATSRTQSEEAVAEMLSAFSEMGPALRAAAPELIERMYVGFQYQDRISQMMTLLLDDMQRMLAILDDSNPRSSDSLNHASWLERLESQYAMAEQRREHTVSESLTSPHSDAPANDAEGGTVFF